MSTTFVDSSTKVTLSGDFDVEVSFSDVPASVELRFAEEGASLLPSPSLKQVAISVKSDLSMKVRYFNSNAWAVQ